VENLRRYFAAFPEVDIVQLDLDWIRRLHSMLDVLKRVLWLVVAVLGLGVLAVIGNTIRLEIQQRRPEIEVTKLVGGSNAFVRRPFLYTGSLLRLFGALLAALIVTGGLVYLDQAVGELSAQYGGRFRLAGWTSGGSGSWSAWARHSDGWGPDFDGPASSGHRTARLTHADSYRSMT
jgi:cell division transport system permease protein